MTGKRPAILQGKDPMTQPADKQQRIDRVLRASREVVPGGTRPAVRDPEPAAVAAPAKEPRPFRRSRANEITSALGLTPIIGRSGPRIAY